MVDRQVLIGLTTTEWARRADFYDYFQLLEKPPNTYVAFSHDSSPAKNRNNIIEQAILTKSTHILLLDDDMAFKPDMLKKLLEHDVDIVTALYLRRSYPHQPLIFDVLDEQGRALYSYLNGSNERLRKIEACGFGCVLLKTSIFEKLEKPYVRLGELDAQEWCDDIGFFNRVKQAGITEVYCDMECMVGHIASMILWPDKFEGKWNTIYDTVGGIEQVRIPQIMDTEWKQSLPLTKD